MKKILLTLVLLFITSCSVVDTNNGDSSSGDGQSRVSVKLGKVGALRSIAELELASLTLTLSANGEDDIVDVVALSGNAQQVYNTSFSDMATLKEWTLTAQTLDLDGVVIHQGTSTFTIPAGGEATVNLTLDAVYSMLRANFFPIRDSVTRCELLLDGVRVDDSLFAAQTIVGDTVQLGHNYVTASPEGINHDVTLDVFGSMWGFEYKLYSGTINRPFISGKDDGFDVVLKWVGPGEPPLGQADMTVTVGNVGTVIIDGELEDTVGILSSFSRYYKATTAPGAAGQSIVKLEDGYAACGISNGDFYLVKTDLNGDTLWTRLFELPGSVERAEDVIKTSDGGFLMVGSKTPTGGGTTGYILKTDAEGVKLWDKTLGSGNESFNAVVEVSDGYVIAGGGTTSGALYIRKFSFTGDITTPYIILDNEGVVKDMVVMPNQIVKATIHSNQNAFTMVTFPASMSAHVKTSFPISQPAHSYAIANTSTGGTLIGGYGETDLGEGSFILMKIDGANNMLWEKRYITNDARTAIKGIVELSSGNIVFTGDTYVSGQPGAMTIHTNASGDELWRKVYVTSDAEGMAGIVAAADGGTVSVGTGQGKLLISKLDSSGN